MAQVILEPGDYRTIGSGNYNNHEIWETWDGTNWIPATEKPNQFNNIFIDQNHEVQLLANEEANNVYLYSAAGPGRKLNLQNFELQVYGALRALTKIGNVFHTNNVTNALIDWIYPETGKIVFKGFSRNVVDRATWSANTTNSRFTVVFDPEPGETLWVNSAFKANAFIIQSGTVVQTLNTAGIPACSTFSFNNQMIFNGNGPYGDLIIEPGATLVSECSSPLAQMIRRSETIPASLMHVKPGGNLVFLGNDPLIDAELILFEGNVIYRASLGNQNLARTTFPSSGNPFIYHNLFFENGSDKILPENLSIRGNLIVDPGVAIIEATVSRITFDGDGIQEVQGWEVNIEEVEINKPSGSLSLNSDLRTKGNLIIKNGQIDFNGFDLYINTEGNGSLIYEGGSWLNLHHLFYQNIPDVLGEQNATFPFEDAYQGGIRKVQLTGNSPGGNLNIRYIEIPGANWEPLFSDTDGTPMLYQLNSYFEISSSASDNSEIEMKISAENLIVDDVDDLRIVSNGMASPGIHLPGQDPVKLWGRRLLAFENLNGQTFTIGSFRELSVLPVVWLNVRATWENQGETLISWSTAREKNNEKFILFRSLEGITNFEPIAIIPSKGDNPEPQEYHFKHKERFSHPDIYFQIAQIDLDGKESYSVVFRLDDWQKTEDAKLLIWPNPHQNGKLNIEFPKNWHGEDISFQLFDSSGLLYSQGSIYEADLEKDLENLHEGIYFLVFKFNNEIQVSRILKR
ncbi:T9SS type A sorting domain-containing protein [Shivajiella indica]|uniref:T9SS type A sorting domain-containing protein n=1 Tax=Shivajiella indica TaxID=872115 RepID=A0ABW5B2P5_9BACT